MNVSTMIKIRVKFLHPTTKFEKVMAILFFGYKRWGEFEL